MILLVLTLCLLINFISADCTPAAASKSKIFLKEIRDKHRAAPLCFLLGNGPSLNRMANLSSMSDHVIIGANKIHMGFERFNFTADYVTMVNGLVLDQMLADKSFFNHPSHLITSHRSQGVCPHVGPRVQLLKTTGKQEFCGDLSKCKIISEGHTVTFVNLQLAFHLGCKRVVLIGVDHSFQQVGDPNSKQTLSGPDPNHFDPSYFANQSWHLADLSGNELAYRVADQKFREAGRIIVDATLGGKCEIFQKTTFEKELASWPVFKLNGRPSERCGSGAKLFELHGWHTCIPDHPADDSCDVFNIFEGDVASRQDDGWEDQVKELTGCSVREFVGVNSIEAALDAFASGTRPLMVKLVLGNWPKEKRIELLPPLARLSGQLLVEVPASTLFRSQYAIKSLFEGELLHEPRKDREGFYRTTLTRRGNFLVPSLPLPAAEQSVTLGDEPFIRKCFIIGDTSPWFFLNKRWLMSALKSSGETVLYPIEIALSRKVLDLQRVGGNVTFSLAVHGSLYSPFGLSTSRLLVFERNSVGRRQVYLLPPSSSDMSNLCTNFSSCERMYMSRTSPPALFQLSSFLNCQSSILIYDETILCRAEPSSLPVFEEVNRLGRSIGRRVLDDHTFPACPSFVRTTVTKEVDKTAYMGQYDIGAHGQRLRDAGECDVGVIEPSSFLGSCPGEVHLVGLCREARKTCVPHFWITGSNCVIYRLLQSNVTNYSWEQELSWMQTKCKRFSFSSEEELFRHIDEHSVTKVAFLRLSAPLVLSSDKEDEILSGLVDQIYVDDPSFLPLSSLLYKQTSLGLAVEDEDAPLRRGSMVLNPTVTAEERLHLPGINVISTWFNSDFDVRRGEMLRVLNSNLENPAISSVHLLLDPGELAPNVTHDKVHWVHSEVRANYSDLFAYANNELSGSIAAIANNDIRFSEMFVALRDSNFGNGSTVFALSRLEDPNCVGDSFFLSPPHGGVMCGPNYKASHDVFVFRAPLSLDLDNVNHLQHHFGAENVVIWELEEAGYNVINPCRQFPTYHVDCNRKLRPEALPGGRVAKTRNTASTKFDLRLGFYPNGTKGPVRNGIVKPTLNVLI